MPTLLRSTLTMFAASSLTLLAFYALNASAQSAWTPAPANPPSGNVAGPLTTSSVGQIKTGNLELNTDGTFANGLIVLKGLVGIGTLTPNSTKGGDGYLDTKDVYLRDAGKWASEVGGSGGSGSVKIVSASICDAAHVGDTALGAVCSVYSSDNLGSDNCQANTYEGLGTISSTPPSIVFCTCTNRYIWQTPDSPNNPFGRGHICH